LVVVVQLLVTSYDSRCHRGASPDQLGSRHRLVWSESESDRSVL